MITRRSAAALLGTALAACMSQNAEKIPADTQTASASEKTIPPPQFLLGDRKAPEQYVLGLSLHCGVTRAWTRGPGRTIINGIPRGRTLAFVTHVARTDAEARMGAHLMRVARRDYPEAFMTALMIAADLDEPVTQTHVDEIIRMLDLRVDHAIPEEERLFSLLAARKAFRTVRGLSETPLVERAQT